MFVNKVEQHEIFFMYIVFTISVHGSVVSVQ